MSQKVREDGQPERPPEARRRDAEVLEAAAKVFYEKGYANASVQDVADELGILKGSLYHYINAKEDLLYRLLLGVHARVHEILTEVSELPSSSAADRLWIYVHRHVVYTAENVRQVSVYHHDVERLSEERRLEILSQRREHEAFVEALIREAQADGGADPELDARLTMRFIFGSFIWMYRWVQPGGGRREPEEIAKACADFTVRGISPAPVASPTP